MERCTLEMPPQTSVSGEAKSLKIWGTTAEKARFLNLDGWHVSYSEDVAVGRKEH